MFFTENGCLLFCLCLRSYVTHVFCVTHSNVIYFMYITEKHKALRFSISIHRIYSVYTNTSTTYYIQLLAQAFRLKQTSLAFHHRSTSFLIFTSFYYTYVRIEQAFIYFRKNIGIYLCSLRCMLMYFIL